MTIKMRAYTGEADQALMRDLVEAFPGDNLHVLDLPYRFSSWSFDDPRTVGLWEDAEGRLLAWAVLQTPFWALDYAYHPDVDAQDIHRQILAWALTRAQEIKDDPGGRPIWFVNVRADQTDRMRDLEQAGFARQDTVAENPWSKVWMQCLPIDLLPGTVLPAGFQIRPLAGMSEVDAYVALHREAFGSTSMTSAWRQRTLRRPEYLPDLDLVVEAPQGTLAAFCILWLGRPGAEGGRMGQVEPLGVGEAFRHQGLGQAILREGVRRLHAHGATSVFVETDDYRDAAFRLYQSAGFQVIHNILVYRKDVDNSAAGL